ncbi:MAG: phage holin family protein [Anaerolineaceae bacterium]
MKKLIIKIAINAIALYAAIAILQNRGITPQNENWLSFIWLALIFGIVNVIIRPLLVVMSCPLLILTLGLGTLIINTAMFVLAGWIGTQFNVGFTVDNFVSAFLGALITSIVSFFLTIIFKGQMESSRH